MSSEVARLREQIEIQSKAAWQGLYGYSQISKHEIINHRLEQLGASFKQLSQVIGPEAAIAIVMEALSSSQSQCCLNPEQVLELPNP